MSDPRSEAARYRAEQELAEGERGSAPSPQWSTREERWAVVETSIQQAIRRGEFDDLPGAGKPLEGLVASSDPDWWIKRKIEREGLSGMAPPAIQLRTEHRGMSAALDELPREADVRAHLEDFNARVRSARLQLEGGPPVVTPTLDVEAEVSAWRDRRAERAPAGDADATGGGAAGTAVPWWRRWARGR